MRELAPAKVNLCLFLGGTRPDGRHELVTVFESISLCDELELSESTHDQVVCPGVDGPNLVDEALRALRDGGWKGPPVRIEIEKRIPVAAGLGGGSADAAAALRPAGRLAPVDQDLASRIAAGLGADVPSQLTPGASLGSGAGELVEPLPALDEHAFVIVPSEQKLSTPHVYAEADRLGLPRGSLEGIRECVLAGLPHPEIVNELEPAARSLCPQVDDALEAVRAAGADDAIVCGSGPTVAGVYWGADAARRAERVAQRLCSRFDGAIAAEPMSS